MARRRSITTHAGSVIKRRLARPMPPPAIPNSGSLSPVIRKRRGITVLLVAVKPLPREPRISSGHGLMTRCIALLASAAVVFVASVQAQSAQRVEEASYVLVGGIEQWVTVRGDDRTNPVLLLLHGGPGDVQSPFISTYAPYETDFVLVQWDQRGAGRTFAKNSAAGVTLER